MQDVQTTRLRNLTVALVAQLQDMSPSEVAAALGIAPRTARRAAAHVQAHPELYTGRGA